MRDPKRIQVVLNELRILWEKYPDWRLGQLLSNLPLDKDLFYIEDDEIINVLQKIQQHGFNNAYYIINKMY